LKFWGFPDWKNAWCKPPLPTLPSADATSADATSADPAFAERTSATSNFADADAELQKLEEHWRVKEGLA
jgi:hypothetical protein